MSALPSLSGAATAVAPAPVPAKPRARGFLHIVRHGVGPGSVYVLTYHRLERPNPAEDEALVGARHAVPVLDSAPSRDFCPMNPNSNTAILSVAKDPGLIDHPSPLAPNVEYPAPIAPDPRPKPAVAEGAQALIDLLERIGVNFRLAEVRGALEDILRLGSANIPDLWLSDDDLLAKGLAES